MKRGFWPRAALACLLTLTLAGCTSAARLAQIEAGAAAGRVAAGVTLERQPDECGRRWALLDYDSGDEAVSVIRRYEAFIAGPINDRAKRCYQFNENQRAGLAR